MRWIHFILVDIQDHISLRNVLTWFTFIFPLSLRQNILQKSKYNASLKTTPHNVELSGTPSKKWIHFFTKPLKKYRPILRSAFPFSKASPTTSGTRDLNLLEAKPHEPQATLNTLGNFLPSLLINPWECTDISPSE